MVTLPGGTSSWLILSKRLLRELSDVFVNVLHTTTFSDSRYIKTIFPVKLENRKSARKHENQNKFVFFNPKEVFLKGFNSKPLSGLYTCIQTALLQTDWISIIFFKLTGQC